MKSTKEFDDLITDLARMMDEEFDDLITDLARMMDEKTVDALLVRILGKNWKTIDFNNLPEHEKVKIIEKAFNLGVKEGRSSSSNN